MELQKHDKEYNMEIYPMINELVDVLYKDDINNLISTKCQTQSDKRVFLMFLIMYFYTYLTIPDEIKDNFNIKNELKLFLTDIIKNPNKRHQCIQLYSDFENSIKKLE